MFYRKIILRCASSFSAAQAAADRRLSAISMVSVFKFFGKQPAVSQFKKVHIVEASHLPVCVSRGPLLHKMSLLASGRLGLPASARNLFAPARPGIPPENSPAAEAAVFRIRTPLAFAAAIPSACRWRILLRSFSATKESTCNTISLRKVPIRSFPRRVSKKRHIQHNNIRSLFLGQNTPLL